MLNIGIIGCGKIAQVRHIPEYEANPSARLAGFFDLNAERAAKIAEEQGGRAYDSYQALLADPAIDAVSVCSANSSHAQIAIAALLAGKHVLCEKPMATTLEDCEKMQAAAEKSGKYLMIDQNQRLAKAHTEARRMVQSGLIGKVLTFRTTFGHGGPETWSVDAGRDVWFFDRSKAVMGAMADLGVHKTDLIQYLLSDVVAEATAKLATLDKKDSSGAPIGVDDNAICIYRMKSGALGTMTASWTHYGAEDNSTILYGTKGILRIYDDPAHAIVHVAPDGTRKEYDVEAIQTNDNQTASGVIDEFVDCVTNGHAPAISGASVLPAMRAVFACIDSSRTGRSILVNE